MITLPISTTNMTGLPIILRGFSFRNASQMRAADNLPFPNCFLLRFLRRVAKPDTAVLDGMVGA